MRVVIAPDSFKGSIDATSAAAAIAEGLRRARPDVSAIECPLGDGGEGTLDVLLAATNGERRVVNAYDPVGRPIDVPVGLSKDGATAIIELARASGYNLLEPHERNPLLTSTFGTGQVIRAAIESGIEQIILCLGGSATVDGGAGLIQPMGLRLIDDAGRTMLDGICGGHLANIWRLAWHNPPDHLEDVRFRIACDVLNPVCGPNGAARVFGPQKGADADAVNRLERGLAHWVSILEHTTGKSLRNEPGTGAAGGAALPLLAFCQTELVPGVDVVFEAVGLTEQIDDADLVITGEGRLDSQSMMGKVVGAVARLCREAHVPCVGVFGAIDETATSAIDALDRVYPLNAPFDETAMRLAVIGEQIARESL
ncbi:MAG TPA: glycerate kinase [Phycisphaerae bacterium]|nr:glycerate kinase [Phycisphaerae bacterium]